MKSKGLFLLRRIGRPASSEAAESRGSKDIPRGQGCRTKGETEEAGRKSFSRSFVHAARKPESGFFIRSADMTGWGGLFKAQGGIIVRNDE
jgi:hypothetical protein